jgi:hypothetical protein
MSAFYAMEYHGVASADGNMGAGSLYIGKGIITGIDIAGGVYDGTYAESNGRILGNATLTFAAGGTLVTGETVPPGSVIPLAVNWPSNFANGQPQTVNVNGQPVQVIFHKIKDIP